MSLQKIIQAVRGPQGLEAKVPGYFAARVEHTRRLEPDSARGYLEKLIAAGPADEDLPRAEAITILSLAHGGAAQELGVNPVECTIQTATVMDEGGQGRRALALLDAGFSALEDAPALLRAIETLRMQQRRASRQLSELLARADASYKAGDSSSAHSLLEELRGLDPKNPAVARLEANLAHMSENSKRRWLQRFGLVTGLAAVAGVVWLGVHWQTTAKQAYVQLPLANLEDLDSVKTRLGELEAFVDRYPVWLGSLGTLEERAQLRVQHKALIEREVAKVEHIDKLARETRMDAELAYREGKRLFDTGAPDEALREMQRALDLAGNDWDRAERVRRDMAAIQESLNHTELK